MLSYLLGDVLEYFLNPEHAWMFGNDVQRAMTEFGGSNGPLDKEAFEHFIDWFLFDFQLRSKRSPLRYVCDTNPYQLPEKDLQALKDILARNRFGFFRVTEVKKPNLMCFQDTKDNETFFIEDNQEISNITTKDFFLCRIAPTDTTWCVVNSSALTVRPSARDLKRIQERPIRNSRQAYREIVRSGHELPNLSLLDLEDGTNMISFGEEGWSEKEDDNCAVCRLMRQMKQEGRTPTQKELKQAFEEAEREKDSPL